MKSIFLKKAEQNLPALNKVEILPHVPDAVMDTGDDIVVDLGNHYVGYLTFNLAGADAYIDAPVRLCVRFCETAAELDEDYSTYNGLLCSSWLQEEIINLDYPGDFSLPRRYAARFVKISVVATPKKVVLSHFRFMSVTSADCQHLMPAGCDDAMLNKIDSVSVNTLKNCMHRVFEDGPKRDRRLWIGDLRLEALTNYCTFNNLPIVRRCLYLIAAGNVNESGFVSANIYEYPDFVSGTDYLADYALLYVATLCDYYDFTHDADTFSELYPVIKGQMYAMHATISADGIVTAGDDTAAFIDWCPGLEKITSLHGVYLYVLNMLVRVLDELRHRDKDVYAQWYKIGVDSALNVLYNKDKRAFVNALDNGQYSVHSAVWMVLGGTVSGDAAKEILLDALTCHHSIKPFTPYMHHYVAEAMVKLGLLDEARNYIKNYWGGMVELGADTFYEVYVPGDIRFSPYGDCRINSMCHAWSCTPSYFIRKYFAQS